MRRILHDIAAAPGLAKGMALIVIVTLMFACTDAFAKELGQRHGPFFVVWARYLGQAAVTVLIFAPRLKSVATTGSFRLQLLRSVLLFTASVFFFSAVTVMPLPNMTAISQVTPLIITGMAALFLSEKIGIYRTLAVIIGFLGALIVIRPGFGGFGWSALLPLAGSTAFAAYSISTRFLSQRDSPWTTLFYTSLAGTLIASFIVPFFWSVPQLSDLPLFVLIGATGGTGQALLIFALRFAPASLLAPFFYTQLIWSVLLSMAFFHEAPDIYTFFGALVIVGAGLFVKLREHRKKRVDRR